MIYASDIVKGMKKDIPGKAGPNSHYLVRVAVLRNDDRVDQLKQGLFRNRKAVRWYRLPLRPGGVVLAETNG